MADITTQTIRDTFLDNLPENVTREEGEEFWNAWLDRQREGHEPDMPTPPVGFQYAPGEVDEIWITFPDPQLRKGRVKKRLTAPEFLTRYARFLRPGGPIHLKSDCRHLHDYTRTVAEGNVLPIEACNTDIYGTGFADDLLSIKTTYEKRFLAQGVPITYIRFSLDGHTEFAPVEFAPDELLQR